MKKEKIEIKRWGCWSKVAGKKKEQFVGYRPMRRADVKGYFKSVASVAKKMGRGRGGWCDRCGILIGGQYTTWLQHGGEKGETAVLCKPLEKTIRTLKTDYGTFYVCEYCYTYKRSRKKQTEATPDLEDTWRYNINLDKLNGEYKEEKAIKKGAEQKVSHKKRVKTKTKKRKARARSKV